MPAVLDDMTIALSLHESLCQKSNMVKEKGQLQELDRMIYELPGLSQCNKNILNEVKTEYLRLLRHTS